MNYSEANSDTNGQEAEVEDQFSNFLLRLAKRFKASGRALSIR